MKLLTISGELIFESEAVETIAELVKLAIAAGKSLFHADLQSANLQSANLQEHTNITGEPWSEYLGSVVPGLLSAGGKTVAEVVGAGAWDCHVWTNCPMAFAFGVDSLEKIPALYRPRADQFVQLFDAGLIPKPEIAPAAEAASS